MDSSAVTKPHENISQELNPSDDSLRIGNDTAGRLFELLNTSNLFSLDRVKISGITGEKSNMFVEAFYDHIVYDLVVFGDEKPSFKEVIKNFEGILKKANDLDIKNIEVNESSIQFNVDGVSFDLHPAKKFMTKTTQPNVPQLQVVNGAKKFIKKYRGYRYKYGGAVFQRQTSN